MGQVEPKDLRGLAAMEGDALVDWLLAGAAPPAPPMPPQTADDCDFLFTIEPLTDAPASSFAALGADARKAELADLLNGGAAERLAALGPVWLADPRLLGVDDAGAELAVRAALALPQGGEASRGALSLLTDRALQSGSAGLATAAVQLATRHMLSDLQESIAICLQKHSLNLTPEQRRLFFDALEALGDGRCVRAMETYLATGAGHLLEHEAWRARHIVQRIRRGGRR